MRKIQFPEIIAIIISLAIMVSCGDSKERKESDTSELPENKKEISSDTLSVKNQTVNEKKSDQGKMSPGEAEILDMRITEYERNAEDLINWSKIVAEVRNLNEANAAMEEYIEVQRRHNENVREIEIKVTEMLGKDHNYSSEYDEKLKAYMSDPERTTRSKRAVNSTMALIDQYGYDPTFQEILKKLEEINRHRIK